MTSTVFNLFQLLETVFSIKPGERICILIDLNDPYMMNDYRFTFEYSLALQKMAYLDFSQAILRATNPCRFGLQGGFMYAYGKTGGDNLDFVDDIAVNASGEEVSLRKDVFKKHDVILCFSDCSIEIPLSQAAKEYGFRAAAFNDINRIILDSWLADDLENVSNATERLRKAMSGFEQAEIVFSYDGSDYYLSVGIAEHRAWKSNDTAKVPGEVASLPGGEIYFVPTQETYGSFPKKLRDGSIGIMKVQKGKVIQASVTNGSQDTIDEYNRMICADPISFKLGSLGFGTRMVPFISGLKKHDKKVFGNVSLSAGPNNKVITLFSEEYMPGIKVERVMLRKPNKQRAVVIDEGEYSSEFWLTSLLR